MNLRRHNVSDSPQTIRRRSSRLSATDELLLNIPIDLVIDIFSNLPLKSIARCRCVSKRWASVLRRPDFTDLFFAKSSARRKVLFACRREDKKEVSFFSTPQILSENVSVTAARDHHVSFSFDRVYDISSPVNGFVCIRDDRILKRRKTRELVSVICNPTTGQSFTSPKLKTRKRTRMRSFLGYDPVEKQHKMLSVTILDKSVVDHQILTLGAGNMTWRLVDCNIPYYIPGEACVCINGVLYYTAGGVFDVDDAIVCFDVRSEKFSSVKPVERGTLVETLINFQGKLASVRPSSVVSGKSTSFEVWILEDLDKHEWSKRVFDLPPMGMDAASREVLYFVGVTDTNEFVFKPFCSSSSEPFYLHYYNFVDKTVTRVEIQGMGAFEKASGVCIFLNHVEDVKLME